MVKRVGLRNQDWDCSALIFRDGAEGMESPKGSKCPGRQEETRRVWCHGNQENKGVFFVCFGFAGFFFFLCFVFFLKREWTAPQMTR